VALTLRASDGRKTLLAPMGTGKSIGIEETKTSIEVVLNANNNDDDLSEGPEDPSLLLHLKNTIPGNDGDTIPPPPPSSPLNVMNASKSTIIARGVNTTKTDNTPPKSPTGSRYLPAEKGREFGREFELNSDISYDSSQDEEEKKPLPVKKDTNLNIKERQKGRDDDIRIQRTPDFHEVEGVRPKNLQMDSFLTAIQEIVKSPNFVDVEDNGSKYVDVDADWGVGRRKLLVEPGCNRHDQLDHADPTTSQSTTKVLDEKETRNMLKLRVASGVAGGSKGRIRRRQEDGGVAKDHSFNKSEKGRTAMPIKIPTQNDVKDRETTTAEQIAAAFKLSVSNTSTIIPIRRSDGKHKKAQSKGKDKDKDNNKNTNKTYTINNESDNTKTTENINMTRNTRHNDEDLADDEQIQPSTRRRRMYSYDSRHTKKRPPGHRRTRSGDDAAATLLTGSTEWIGMEMDELPVPLPFGDDDDDDDDTCVMLSLDVGGDTRKKERGFGGGEKKDDVESGVVSSSGRSGSVRRQNTRSGTDVGSDRISGGRRGSSASDSNNSSNGKSGSRELRQKVKQQKQQQQQQQQSSSSSSKKLAEQSGSSWETPRSLPPNVLDNGTVGDSDEGGKQQQQHQQQQQQHHQPEWFNPSRTSAGAKYPPYMDPDSNTDYNLSGGSSAVENIAAESEFLISRQKQPHNNDNNNNNSNSNSNSNSDINHNIHTMFSADDRQESIGDASISTIESHGSHSVFSWISNKVSVATGNAHKHDYQHHVSGGGNGVGSMKDNTDGSLNLSDDEYVHHGSGCSLKEKNDIFGVADTTDIANRFLKRGVDGNGRRRGHSPKKEHLDPTLSAHQHVRTYTPEFLPNLGNRQTMEVRSCDRGEKKYPVYTCPRCSEEQRIFFNVNSTPNSFLEGPAAPLGIYIGIYLLVSLTIIGLEVSCPLD